MTIDSDRSGAPPRGHGRWAGTRQVVAGTISSAGFGSGDRFVVGCWPVSPVGPICDVMWAAPDDRRVLLASSSEAAAFISAIYRFDEVRVVPLEVHSDGRRTTVASESLELELIGGRCRPVPFPRPLWTTRFVEAPIARALMGVETYGTSPTGAREWYQSRGWRWVADGRGRLDGVELGRPVRLSSPLRVGFSEPPSRPSIVSVRVTIDFCT